MAEILRSVHSRLTRSRLIRSMYFDAAVPLARRFPMPSHVFGPVKLVHDSVGRWLAEDPRRGTLEVLHPSEELRYPAPGICVPELPCVFSLRAAQRLPARFVAQIRHGRIARNSYDVVSPDDGVFGEFFFGAEHDGVGASSLTSLRMPLLRRKPGGFALILTHRAGNYYHWINDCLTRLHVLESAGVESKRLIVPRRMNRFQRESLELLGFTDDDLAPFGDEYWSVDELVVPSLTAAPQHSCPASCRWLRRRFVDNADVARTKGGPKRIYISRAGATKRRLLNEDEVVSCLAEQGFQTIRMESLAVREQVALAHGADVVVAPHGAGLTNATFMREGATLVELLPAKRAKPCYYSLAAAVGLRYGCVTDAVPGEARSARRAPEKDFQVPVERVAMAVEWALGETQ